MKPSMESDLTDRLATSVRAFDKKGTAAICGELSESLWRNDTAWPKEDAEHCLEDLRDQRFFTLMQQLADAFIQTGQDSFKIRRLYIQSLLEQNNFTAALSFLRDLEACTAGNVGENAEARGLMGRAYNSSMSTRKTSRPRGAGSF